MNHEIKLVRTPHNDLGYDDLEAKVTREINDLYQLAEAGDIPHQVATMFDSLWRVFDLYTAEIERLQKELKDNRAEIGELQARLNDIDSARDR